MTPACVPSPFDPTSTAVPLRLPYTGDNLSTCDYNVFSITIAEWDLLYISFSPESDSITATFTVVFPFAIPEPSIFSLVSGTNNNFTVPPGTHNITFFGDGHYSFSASRAATVAPCACDAGESDEDTPVSITSLPATISATICPFFDSDAFSIDVADTYRLNVRVEGSSALRCYVQNPSFFFELKSGEEGFIDVTPDTRPEVYCNRPDFDIGFPDLAGAYGNNSYSLFLSRSAPHCTPDGVDPSNPPSISAFPFHSTFSICGTGDSDTFTFSLNFPHAVSVTWNQDWILASLDPYGPIDSGVAVNLPTGTYSLILASAYPPHTGDYDLTVSAQPLEECRVDTLEPTNDEIPLLPLPLASTTSYFCPQTDTDVFRVQADSHIEANITVSLPENSVFTISRSQSTNFPISMASSGTLSLSLFPGEYTLSFSPPIPAPDTIPIPYSFEIDTAPLSCTGSLADSNEPNDSQQSATAVSLPATLTTTLCPADDIDVFSFDVAGPSLLTITVSSSTPSLFVEAWIWQANKEPRPVLTPFSSLFSAGRYYLSLSSADQFHVGSADVEITATSSAFGIDRYEPNETPATATHIAIPSTHDSLSLTPFLDDDWFAIDVASAAELHVELTVGEDQPEIPPWGVYTADGSTVALPDGPYPSNTFIEVLVGPGRYYIHAHVGTTTISSYTLSVRTASPPAQSNLPSYCDYVSGSHPSAATSTSGTGSAAESASAAAATTDPSAPRSTTAAGLPDAPRSAATSSDFPENPVTESSQSPESANSLHASSDSVTVSFALLLFLLLATLM
jgi:hypothetical protein